MKKRPAIVQSPRAAGFEQEPASWSKLLGGGSREGVKPGAELLQQGFHAESVIVLESGLVKLLCTYPDGRSAIVGLRGRDSLLGIWASLRGCEQPLSAVAISPCVVFRIPAREFIGRLREGGDLSWRVHLEHAKELMFGFEQAAALACLSARERLAGFLRLLRSEFLPGRNGPMEVPLRHWEMAQLLAITPQYLSQLMHELVSQGCVRRGNRWILTGKPLLTAVPRRRETRRRSTS